MREMDIEVHLITRITDVVKEGDRITALESADGERFDGDVFVDCTGNYRPYGKLYGVRQRLQHVRITLSCFWPSRQHFGKSRWP